jgi:hypothetical protein
MPEKESLAPSLHLATEKGCTALKRLGGLGKKANQRSEVSLRAKGGNIPVAKAIYGEQVAFVVNDVIAMRTANS